MRWEKKQTHIHKYTHTATLKQKIDDAISCSPMMMTMTSYVRGRADNSGQRRTINRRLDDGSRAEKPHCQPAEPARQPASPSTKASQFNIPYHRHIVVSIVAALVRTTQKKAIFRVSLSFRR